MNFDTSSPVAPLEWIGFGHCGPVWGTLRPNGKLLDIAATIKREDASPGRDIMDELSVQSQNYAASSLLQRTLVPRCLGFIDSHDERWQQVLPLLPIGFEGCRTMVAEKINPLSTQAQ